jgi:predicted TIM-barrel fold metal-dependent hydrolase
VKTAHGYGRFDAHLHIIDPRFPLVENQGFVPQPFPAAAYTAVARPLGITGGAVVSGSFQGFDQSYLIDALTALGPTFVGVTQLEETVTDQQIARLEALGVRAVRFNLRRGGSAPVAALERLAARVFAVAGWHVELYVDGGELEALAPTLRHLPRVAIDHLGLSAAGLPALLRLAGAGVHVKASGFGRVDFDVPAALAALAAANPAALLFGSDLPSTRAPRPFRAADIALIEQALSPPLARRALRDNAVALYRPAAA